MKKTQHKIIKTAIQLFNKNGVANVRVQDIAVTASISPGNLTYHYKTKKDLMNQERFNDCGLKVYEDCAKRNVSLPICY